MSNVIPFQKRPKVEYKYQPDAWRLFTILRGLTSMYGNDDASKTAYIKQNCPHLSRAMLETFKDKVNLSCQENEKNKTIPPLVYEWMTR